MSLHESQKWTPVFSPILSTWHDMKHLLLDLDHQEVPKVGKKEEKKEWDS